MDRVGSVAEQVRAGVVGNVVPWGHVLAPHARQEVDQMLPAREALMAAIAEVIYPVLINVFVTQGNEAARRLLEDGDTRIFKQEGAPEEDVEYALGTFAVLHETADEVERFLAQAGGDIARSLSGEAAITDDMIDALRQELVGAYRGPPVSLTDLQRRVRDTIDASLVRALRVARTEVGRATMEGKQAAMARVDLPKEKRWITAGDGLARESHQAYESQGWVEEGHTYGGVIQYPLQNGAPAGEVVNCRCDLEWRRRKAA